MSLFNPWVLLGILMAVISSFGGGYYKGSTDEVTRQQLEIAALNAEARQKEQALATAVNVQAIQLQKANQNAKLLQQKHNADIESGLLKLRVAVKASDCPVPTSADSELTSRSDIGNAEIQPETSRAILAIGDEADNTVRKLNACITLYNQAREMINERK